MADAVLITPPATAPISAVEAGLHARSDAPEDAALLTVYVDAATDYVEKYVGRVLMPQTWEQSLDAFPTGTIKLPVGPVTAIQSVTYVDPAGATITLDPSAYVADLASVQARLEPVVSWPQTKTVLNAVTLRWTAGTGCPHTLKQAIRLLAAHWYNVREAVVVGTITAEVPLTVKALLERERRFLG